MDRIVLLAREYGLHVIEDAAEGMGIKIDGVHVGTIGDIGVLSFNGNKVIKELYSRQNVNSFRALRREREREKEEVKADVMPRNKIQLDKEGNSNVCYLCTR